MSTGFSVDTISLMTLSGTLANVYGKMETITQVTPQFGTTLGGASIATALNGFCKQWEYGLARLSTNLEGAVVNTQKAAESYSEAERMVCIATTPGG